MKFSSVRPLLLAAATGLMLSLTGCADVNPPMNKLPEMSFRQHAPFQVNVGRVIVKSDARPTGQPPHIEHDMPVAPENAIKRWVQDRLAPIGREGTLRVVIHNASATETPLKTDQGLTGMFKREQAARVEMAIDVTLEILDERQSVIAETSGKQSRSQTTPENQKLNERDKLLYGMVQDMLNDFDRDMQGSIPTYLGKWLYR